MIKAIGYVRCSTDKQDESLDQQQQKLAEFAQAKGWDLVHVYADDAISGSDMERPGLRLLLERVQQDGQIAAVVAWDRNRLARPKDPLEGMILERQVLTAGKRIIYASSGAEVDRSFIGGLMGYVEHHQNGDYLRKLSRDAMRGVVSRAREGLWPGGRVPWGL
jgi:site-specific DNA recombinase